MPAQTSPTVSLGGRPTKKVAVVGVDESDPVLPIGFREMGSRPRQFSNTHIFQSCFESAQALGISLSHMRYGLREARNKGDGAFTHRGVSVAYVEDLEREAQRLIDNTSTETLKAMHIAEPERNPIP